MNCIQCGIPFSLHENGYLYIKSTEDLSELSFEFLGESVWVTEYDGYSRLINKIENVRNCSSSSSAALSSKKVLPAFTVPVQQLMVRLQHSETVSLIQSGSLISYLQPIIELQKNGDLFGYESLLRTGGEEQISPGILFSIAEQSGMLSLLDQRAREAAIKAKKEHIKQGIKSFINFLPSTIYNPDFCLQHTFELVRKYDIDPADLVFEVVETEKIENISHLKKVLETYKREGMKVALDDVGAGFSTLEVLKMLNPDIVKIDRQFIDHCDQESRKQQFLAEVMKLSRELNITVLAEGIERAEELEYCRTHGVHLAQGYLIGKPTQQPSIPKELVK
ncbi:MAG: EAL domain-containing protein [Bacillota bacterium]|nr:EAL domain-containing protein [Bacillota bacterium]